MATRPAHTDIAATKSRSHQPLSPSTTIDDQLFRLSIGTILSAYLYGHMTEACALRGVARAIRERLLEQPAAVDMSSE